MTDLIRINNITPIKIHWPNVHKVHVFHPIMGQLEGIRICDECGTKLLEWAGTRVKEGITFCLFDPNEPEWTYEEFLTFACSVIELTHESERRFITFHVLPRAEVELVGFQAVPFMMPPLVEEERRYLRYVSHISEWAEKHHDTHTLLEAKSDGRPN